MNTKSIFEKRTAAIVGVLLVFGVAFGSGFFIGTKKHASPLLQTSDLTGKEEGIPPLVDFSAFWKTWNILNEHYVATKGIPTSQEKVWGAIAGLAASLGDPYTIFLPPEEKKMFEEQIGGHFEGVGMEIDVKDRVLTVIAPLKGNPAEKAGIRSGDKILKINDAETGGMTTQEAVALIRGKKGTEVRLTLGREGRKPFEVKLIRDTITIPTIDTEFRPDNIFVIRLYNFSAVSAELFKGALRQFVEKAQINPAFDTIILDLRGNPGGYLEAAVDMASWFLPAGEVVVREEGGHSDEPRIYRSHGYNIFSDRLKMAILIDQGSASASEILAGALKEHGKAILVGTKTFGKGSVQELFPITASSSVKVTIARWLTPKSVSISEGGLKPDIEVSLTEDDIAAKRDTQMEAAAKELKRRALPK